ncbi:MAG: hypothetical protein AB1349_11000 [Elusimicrobiota bacterium]
MIKKENPMVVKNALMKNLEEYHKIISGVFYKYWKLYLLVNNYDADKFLSLFYSPRETFFKFCKNNNINYSSIAGTIQEWTLYHFLRSGLKAVSKENKVTVDLKNGYKHYFFEIARRSHYKIYLQIHSN